MACGSCTGGGACSCSSGCTVCPVVKVHDWLPSSTSSSSSANDLVQVAFKGRRQDTYRNSRDLPIQAGDYVVVAARKGVDFGYVTMTGELVRRNYKGDPTSARLRSIVRSATIKDIERHESNREAEKQAIERAQDEASRLKLKMLFVDAEWQFDRRRISFFFTASKRPDFRELVRRLSPKFRARIDLRHITPRQDAARVGGIGDCGRELCCSTWLTTFPKVTIRNARIQGFPLNRDRITGQCGQLKCCLNYELEQYMEALADYPSLNSKVSTANGEGTVAKIDIFTGLLWISFRKGEPQIFTLEELKPYLEKNPRKKQTPTRKRAKKAPRPHNSKAR